MTAISSVSSYPPLYAPPQASNGTPLSTRGEAIDPAKINTPAGTPAQSPLQSGPRPPDGTTPAGVAPAAEQVDPSSANPAAEGRTRPASLTPALQALGQSPNTPPPGDAANAPGAAPLAPTRDADGDGRVSLNELATSYGDPSSSASTREAPAAAPAPPVPSSQDMNVNEQVRQNVSRLMESYGGPARNGNASEFNSIRTTA